MRPFFSFLFISVVMATLGGWMIWYDHTHVSVETRDLILFIDPGTSVTQISSQLEEAGLIRSPLWWKLIGRLERKSSRIKAGEYEFTGAWTPAQVLDKLVEGKSVLHFLTFPEGLTTQEIFQRIETAPLLEGDLPSLPPEGSLFPETYAYKYGDTKESLVKRLQLTMTQKVQLLWEERDSQLPYKTPQDLLILASIIEKETSLPLERPRVAAVFINRLKKGMPLQADPTLLYGLTQEKGEKQQTLSKEDLARDFSYNTYRHRGLPPTPIACPSFSSLQAAAHPLSTSDLYFVADGTGAHQFAATLADHQKNHKYWRQIQKSKKILR